MVRGECCFLGQCLLIDGRLYIRMTGLAVTMIEWCWRRSSLLRLFRLFADFFVLDNRLYAEVYLRLFF